MRVSLDRLRPLPFPVRIAAFLGILLVIWVPLALPLSLLIGDRNVATIVTMGLLYLELLAFFRVWGQQVHSQVSPLQHYGLELGRTNFRQLLSGLALGLGSCLALFCLQGVLGGLVWQSSALPLPRLVGEGLLMALLIGFTEELVFRGWLLDELERDYPPDLVLWLNALIFAGLHFIKPLEEILQQWLTFPALVLFGMVMVLAKRSSRTSHRPTGSLSRPIGLHAGLVWGYYIINVGQLVTYTDRLPIWVTGVNQNPLASVTGLLFLAAIAWLMQHYAKSTIAR